MIVLKSKEKVGILLFFSAVLVLYPQISAYLELEEQIGTLRSIPSELAEVRDDYRLSLIGFSLLFLTLFLMLHYAELKDGSGSISKARQNNQDKPLSKKARESVFVVSAFAFIIVYVWQMAGLMPVSTPNLGTFVMPLIYALLLSAVVGILGYFVAKQLVPLFSLLG